jgi:hypothetical protein
MAKTLAILLITLAVVHASPLLAVDNEDDEDTEEIKLDVPERLRGKGYRLRLLGEEETLRETLTLTEDRKTYQVRLLDAKRRVLDSENVSQRGFFRALYPNDWRVSVAVGATGLDRRSHERLFLRGPLSTLHVQLTNRWHALNWHLFAAGNGYKQGCPTDKLCAKYSSEQVGGGAGYEWAADWLEGLHTTASIFFVYEASRYFLSDRVVTIASKDSTFAPRASLDFNKLVGNSFLVFFTTSAQFMEIEFKEVGFKKQLVQSNYCLGVSYDFH